jgi:hypothetical protein
MRLDELIISSDVRARLGNAGAHAVAGALHPGGGDCQTCVRPLVPGGISLCVDDTSILTVASLHHTTCRPSGWNSSGVVVTACQSVTFAVNCLLIEDSAFGPMPVMTLNPSLEQVAIKALDGGWHPTPQYQYTKAGMQVRVTAADAPPPTAATISARVNARGVIRVTVPSGNVYPDANGSPAPPPMLDLARRDGLVLAVTHAVDAAAMNDIGLVNKIVQDPLTVLGRVALHG